MTLENQGRLLSWTIWAGAPGPLSLQVLPPRCLPMRHRIRVLQFVLVCAGEQVWRQWDISQDNFQLVCDNAVSALQTGRNDFDIPEAEQCTFEAGDSIGWSQRPGGSGIISFTPEGATPEDLVRFR